MFWARWTCAHKKTAVLRPPFTRRGNLELDFHEIRVAGDHLDGFINDEVMFPTSVDGMVVGDGVPERIFKLGDAEDFTIFPESQPNYPLFCPVPESGPKPWRGLGLNTGEGSFPIYFGENRFVLARPWGRIPVRRVY